MTTTPVITELPDYPSIRKLACALHRLDASRHGAAIMIGAGFSRGAARHVGGEKRVPLWGEFTRSLAKDLTTGATDLSFSDPLRVAEEYRAYFGQAALNDKIRFEIEDEAWQAGPLYRSLLELPWSEILTTNWDTLLERAAKDIHSPYYTPVTKPSDLAWAPSPRIAKLHGTIGVTDAFIAAQEDYRTYPRRFAPFVNFARQVFIENELCLLGFSGDDPNFLQWAGWVRDHLADHARKIYLVGALNLSAARRKHLESTNVAPVDLWQAVAHIADQNLRHQTAIKLFLEALRDEGKSKPKPQEWQPTRVAGRSFSIEDHERTLKDPTYGAGLLAGQLDALKRDRESYPGWLVCPPSLSRSLAHQLNMPAPNPNNLAALAPADQAKLLYEIAWRHGITFQYIAPWLADALFQVANPGQPCALSKRQQLDIALVLLNNCRWPITKGEVGQRVIDERSQTLIDFLEKYAPYLPDCAAEVAYHRALVARDKLNYGAMAAVVQSVVGEDPVWKLRQAALLMELGRSEEAAQLVARAYGELRENHRRDRYSIPILSRLAWAHWLLRAAQPGGLGQTSEELPAFVESNYRQWECDPWSWIHDLRYRIEKRREKCLERQNPIEPLFEQGHYRDHSDSQSWHIDISETLVLDGLSRSIGIPLHSGDGVIEVDLLAGDAERIVLSGGIGVELWDNTLAIRAASSESSPSIKGVLTRIGVARASREVADTLAARALSAIAFWRGERKQGGAGRQMHALSRLRVFVEVLARLVVRLTPEKAKDVFRLAASLGQEPELRHFWLSEAVADLLNHSLASVPESLHGELLPDALAFPLPSEVMNGDPPRWPNPVIQYPDVRDAYRGIEKRIGEIIDIVASSDKRSRTDALSRLLPLAAKAGFLSTAERARLADAIWAGVRSAGDHALPDTDLFPYALLLLPAPDSKHAETLVRAFLYNHGTEVLEETQKELRCYPSPEIQRAIMIYDGMANAAADETMKLFPSAEQALLLFERLVTWRPHAATDGPFQFAGRSRRNLAESVGRALSYAIVPALAAEAKTVERFEELHALYSQVDGARTTLPAFVHFTHLNGQTIKVIEKIIRTALRSRDAVAVGYAAIAMRTWMDLPNAAQSAEFMSLTSWIITTIESGRTVGLHQLIGLAEELLEKKWLDNDQVAILVEAIPAVFESTDYATVDANSREAVSASTIRAACAKVARVLHRQFPNNQDLADLVVKSRADPLPEVRFVAQANE